MDQLVSGEVYCEKHCYILSTLDKFISMLKKNYQFGSFVKKKKFIN